MFVKITRFKQVCQLLLSLIVAMTNSGLFLASLLRMLSQISWCPV